LPLLLYSSTLSPRLSPIDKTLTSATGLRSSKLCLLQTAEAKQQKNYQQQQASTSNEQHACISDHDS
jgi:hypothetical protein